MRKNDLNIEVHFTNDTYKYINDVAEYEVTDAPESRYRFYRHEAIPNDQQGQFLKVCVYDMPIRNVLYVSQDVKSPRYIN